MDSRDHASHAAAPTRPRLHDSSILGHFSPGPQLHTVRPTPCTPLNVPIRTAQADLMLIGACNPTLYPKIGACNPICVGSGASG